MDIITGQVKLLSSDVMKAPELDNISPRTLKMCANKVAIRFKNCVYQQKWAKLM